MVIVDCSLWRSRMDSCGTCDMMAVLGCCAGYWALTGLDTNKGPSIDVFWTRLHRTRAIGRVVCIHIRWRLQVTRVTLPTGPGTRTTVAWIRIRRWSRIVFQMLGTLWSGRNQLGTGWWWHWATRGRWRLFVQVLARTWMARIVAAARWVVLGKLGVEVCRRVRMGVVHLRRVLAVGWGRVVVGRQVRRWTVHLDRTGVYARWTGRAVTTEGLRSRRQIASC